MAEFIHSILAPNQVVAADGEQTFDLPVLPLSAILIHLNPLQESGTITTHRLFEGLLSALDNIRVTHKGTSVFDANGVDAAMVALAYHRLPIWQSNAVETNNDRRSLVLPILFGRGPYMPNECFPATRKGEFQLTINFDIADGGFDSLRMSLETIELPEVTPEFVQKVTTLAQTLAATGQNDIELPIGNVIRAILLFGTTPFAGAVPVPSLGQLSVFVDNRQRGYSATDFEVLRSVMGLTGVPFPPDSRHIHSVDAAGGAREDTLEAEVGASIDDNYALLHFDPTHDDLYSLDTAGAGRVNVRTDAETADAIRALPIERVSASDFLES